MCESNEEIFTIKSTSEDFIPLNNSGLKSGFKSGSKKTKKVNWKSEEEINEVKVFKFFETADSPGISEEEYKKIQEEMLENFRDY